MKKALSLVLALVMAFTALCGISSVAMANTSKIITVKYYQSDARSMLKLVNDFRKGSDAWYYDQSGEKQYCSGLKDLAYDYDLEKVAMQRAAEIATSFSHTRPNGSICFSLYGSGYYDIGENIAGYCSTTKMAFELWQENDNDYSGQGHRRNMLSSGFTAVGIACVEYNGQKYWVQAFRNPALSSVETPVVDGNMDVDVMTDTIKLTPAKTTTTTKPATTTTTTKPATAVAKPKKATISKLKAGKKQFTVSWKKLSGVTGYEVQYSTSSKFTKSTTKSVKVKGASKTSKAVTKLKGKKKYYVRVRAYKIKNGSTANGSWSAKKSVTTKK